MMEPSFPLFFLAAIVLDLLIGDPSSYPHPVRLIGWLCSFFEKHFRRIFSKNLQIAGLLATFCVLVTTGGVVFFVLALGHFCGQWVEIIIAVLLLYTTVAIRDLLIHSRRVYKELCKKNNLTMARRAVGMIVGRDTAALDEPGVIRACVETVAENMADGIVAPLFWAMAAVVCDGIIPQLTGGLEPISYAALGAFLYKACNTMDSMYGYKNERYLEFGRFAARLDDFAGYLPARIAGGCLVLAAPFVRLSGRKAAFIMRRDHARHASPNAGYPEAAMAGALGVQLGGASLYFGRINDKPTLGDFVKMLEVADILRANRLVCVGTVFFVLSCLLFYSVFAVFFV